MTIALDKEYLGEGIAVLALDLPGEAELCAVDEDIFWLRMPLPFDLDHINLYLIKDGDAYAAIDCGIGTKTTEAIWERILHKLDKPLSKIIVTHMHPDHIGMAGYLSERFKAPLYMSMGEYFTARALVAGGRGASDWQDIDYLQKCGMSQDYIEKAIQNRRGMDKVVRPIPLAYKRLSHGDEICIGETTWQILVGRGHSPEHACLYNKDKQVLISGDHVLPKISPNIGAYSTEPEANPLRLYLETLPQFFDLPEQTKVLPSHKLPFSGLHTRVEQLIEHHQSHLDNLMVHCAQPQTVKSCLAILFARKLNPHNMFFALAEALAHLNYLFYEGRLKCSLNDSNQWLFKAKV